MTMVMWTASWRNGKSEAEAVTAADAEDLAGAEIVEIAATVADATEEATEIVVTEAAIVAETAEETGADVRMRKDRLLPAATKM